MKLNIKREPFQKAFQMASIVAPQRSPKAVLQNIKIQAEDAETVITATDMEVAIRLVVPEVEVQTPGEALIPVQRLNMIVRESNDETLVFETDSEKTIISGSHSRFELAAADPIEFPAVAGFDSQDYYEIAAQVLKEMIRRTLFATDAESSRFALSGVLLEVDGDHVTAVGTDGRRLAKMEGSIAKVGDPQTEGVATIVPARAMQLIERILPDDETKIQLAPRANDLWLQAPGIVFFTRLVEGRFPKWRDVLPKRDDSNRIDLPVGPMFAALRQAAVVANEESRGVDFTFGNGTLVLSNRTAEVGQSRVEMPIPFEGDELTIALDHRYVADFLKVLPPDKMFTLDIANGEAAAYCETDDSYGYVIMPLSKDRR